MNHQSGIRVSLTTKMIVQKQVLIDAVRAWSSPRRAIIEDLVSDCVLQEPTGCTAKRIWKINELQSIGGK